MSCPSVSRVMTLEMLAEAEHERWMQSKLDEGWAYAPKTDRAKKLHKCLVPWEKLPDKEKEKDRDLVRGIPTDPGTCRVCNRQSQCLRWEKHDINRLGTRSSLGFSTNRSLPPGLPTLCQDEPGSPASARKKPANYQLLWLFSKLAPKPSPVSPRKPSARRKPAATATRWCA